MKIDRIDLKILIALQQSGRLTNKELADRVGLSASPCLARVRRLEKLGLIQGYRAQINIRRLCSSILVIAQIYMNDCNSNAARTLERYLLGLPQTCELYDVNGQCDYVVRFACRGTDDFYMIASALLDDRSFHVRQVTSFIVLRELRGFSGYDVLHLTSRDEHAPQLPLAMTLS